MIVVLSSLALAGPSVDVLQAVADLESRCNLPVALELPTEVHDLDVGEPACGTPAEVAQSIRGRVRGFDWLVVAHPAHVEARPGHLADVGCIGLSTRLDTPIGQALPLSVAADEAGLTVSHGGMPPLHVGADGEATRREALNAWVGTRADDARRRTWRAYWKTSGHDVVAEELGLPQPEIQTLFWVKTRFVGGPYLYARPKVSDDTKVRGPFDYRTQHWKPPADRFRPYTLEERERYVQVSNGWKLGTITTRDYERTLHAARVARGHSSALDP